MTTESHTYLISLHDNKASIVTADFFESSEAGFTFFTESKHPAQPIAYYSRASVESIIKQTSPEDLNISNIECCKNYDKLNELLDGANRLLLTGFISQATRKLIELDEVSNGS